MILKSFRAYLSWRFCTLIAIVQSCIITDEQIHGQFYLIQVDTFREVIKLQLRPSTETQTLLLFNICKPSRLTKH